MSNPSTTLETQAISAMQHGNFQNAKKLWKEMLRLSPDHVFAGFHHGLCDIHTGKALSGYHSCRAILPRLKPLHQLEAWTNLGLALFQAGYWPEARQALLQAARLGPLAFESKNILTRLEPPDYLPIEVFSTSQNETLLTAACKEAGTFVYVIDIVGTCNLRCPSCPVGNSPLGKRSRGIMTLEVFNEIIEKILKESPVSKPQIWLFNWGEPLLHPDLPKMLQTLNHVGLPSYLSTNLNRCKSLEAVIEQHPTDLKISISGFSQNTYGQTHTKGDLDKVRKNLHQLRTFMDTHQKTHKPPTKIWVCQHLYQNNLEEQHALEQLCRTLDFDYQPIAAFYQPLEKLKSIAEGQHDTNPILDLLLEHPNQYIQRFRQVRDRKYDCELRANQMVINHDANVTLCCSTYSHEQFLDMDFLKHDHDQLQAAKYKHSFCKSCYEHGLCYTPSLLLDVTN